MGDTNFQVSLLTAFLDLYSPSIRSPQLPLGEQEWFVKLQHLCKRKRRDSSWAVNNCKLEVIVKMAATVLPGMGRPNPYEWMGDHLFAEKRKDLRIISADKQHRVLISELFFAVALRGSELVPKSVLWARCGDKRCVSPVHLAVVKKASISDRLKCFQTMHQGRDCPHEPSCIRENPLPPPARKEKQSRPIAGTSEAEVHNAEVQKCEKSIVKGIKELAEKAKIQ